MLCEFRTRRYEEDVAFQLNLKIWVDLRSAQIGENKLNITVIKHLFGTTIIHLLALLESRNLLLVYLGISWF